MTQGSTTSPVCFIIFSQINWVLSDLRMEEKKKSSRSRLRLFPSFSVKTGVFNKQVVSMMTSTMVVMKRVIMVMMKRVIMVVRRKTAIL